MDMKKIPEPLTIFLIGVTGDLAKKKILKAIYRLYQQDLISSPFNVVGNSRKQLSPAEFKEFVKNCIHPEDEGVWSRFAECLHYVAGDATQPQTFAQLQSYHLQLEQNHRCGNHMWYIATLPQLYLKIIQNLKQYQLHKTACGWTKILIEKPFGTDLQSAQALNQELSEVFTEDQIYRIDHFLGKETVQNLVAFRFANGLFEELWNRTYIDHVQVTFAETLGVTGREEFYDATGSTRDVLQNHLLQMIAVTLMEEPASLHADDIRHSRSQLLNEIVCTSSQTQMNPTVAFGQYVAGTISQQPVPGYAEENHISTASLTETATALKLHIDNPRWQGVPIYVRTGKRLATDVLEISVQFKDPRNAMFKNIKFGPDPNILTFRFQPNEGIILRLFVKKPGHGTELDMVPMEFRYHNQYQMDFIEAYERLILDASLGDPTLFPNDESIEATWRVIDQILESKPKTAPQPYPAGSWGPDSFNDLIARDGRVWIDPALD